MNRSLPISEKSKQKSRLRWCGLSVKHRPDHRVPAEIPGSVVFSGALAVHARLPADFAASLIDTVLLPALRARAVAAAPAPA